MSNVSFFLDVVSLARPDGVSLRKGVGSQQGRTSKAQPACPVRPTFLYSSIEGRARTKTNGEPKTMECMHLGNYRGKTHAACRKLGSAKTPFRMRRAFTRVNESTARTFLYPPSLFLSRKKNRRLTASTVFLRLVFYRVPKN